MSRCYETAYVSWLTAQITLRRCALLLVMLHWIRNTAFELQKRSSFCLIFFVNTLRLSIKCLVDMSKYTPRCTICIVVKIEGAAPSARAAFLTVRPTVSSSLWTTRQGSSHDASVTEIWVHNSESNYVKYRRNRRPLASKYEVRRRQHNHGRDDVKPDGGGLFPSVIS